jgi:hypothetical protein
MPWEFFMKVWMLIALSLFSLSAFSTEFSHIKLNPEFEKFITRTPEKSGIKKAITAKSLGNLSSDPVVAEQRALQTKLMSAILGVGATSSGGFTGTIPIDGEESPLYQEIRRQLETSHQSIGLSEVQTINRFNQQFNLGSSNFSGFSWQKPFGVVQVYADRQVTPNIFGQNWLVMDTFTFEIEATTFLEKLNEAGLSQMSATEIGAFAGITFKRVYTYWSYANSYQEGLIADFSKLFLPFLKFTQAQIENMGNEEIMKREDVWTASAGGLISTPPIYNISFSGGVLAEYDYQNVTTLQSFHTGEHRFKVGVLAKKTASVGATMELQLDFFKLIKFSLLRYDINYEYASGKEFTLGLKPEQWAHIKNDSEEGPEFRSILKGFGAVKKLEPYVVRLDESTSSALEQRGSVLLWGKMQKQKTEQIRVIKDNNVRVFFKNYAQNVKVVQNFFSRIFSAIVYKLLKLPVGVNNAAVYSRQLTMEYEATHPQASDPKISRIENSEQFSFILTQYYNAARTDRWVDRRFKNDLTWFVDHFTTLPKSYKTDIKNEVLKGPMMIESNLRVEKAGFQYLLESSENDVFGHIVKVCNSNKNEEWTNEQSRREMLEESQNGSDRCVKEIGQNFISFKTDYLSNYLKPSLVKFKDFVTKYYKKAGNLEALSNLFGQQNTFINGRLQAKTSMGGSFNTTFSSGQFRGLGVIDNFKRSTGSRMPASIASE